MSLFRCDCLLWDCRLWPVSRGIGVHSNSRGCGAYRQVTGTQAPGFRATRAAGCPAPLSPGCPATPVPRLRASEPPRHLFARPPRYPAWRAPGLRPTRLPVPVSGHSGLILINAVTPLYCDPYAYAYALRMILRDR